MDPFENCKILRREFNRSYKSLTINRCLILRPSILVITIADKPMFMMLDGIIPKIGRIYEAGALAIITTAMGFEILECLILKIPESCKNNLPSIYKNDNILPLPISPNSNKNFDSNFKILENKHNISTRSDLYNIIKKYNKIHKDSSK